MAGRPRFGSFRLRFGGGTVPEPPSKNGGEGTAKTRLDDNLQNFATFYDRMHTGPALRECCGGAINTRSIGLVG